MSISRLSPGTFAFAYSRLSATTALIVCLAAPLGAQTPGTKLPSNLGAGLRELLMAHQQSSLLRSAAPLNGVAYRLDGSLKTDIRQKLIETDAQNRVLVELRLDGRSTLAAIRQAATALGGRVVAESSIWRQGAISVYLPLDAAAGLASLPGVRAVHLSHVPFTRAGRVTAQGAGLHRTTQANALGLTGAGITVGVISDTYDTALPAFSPVNAIDDVLSGDLPSITSVPNGPGLKFMIEGAPRGTDEGRAMAQIVHDLAPDASLCFATAAGGQVAFANNILALRARPACNADVIVDDIAYLAEPFFSDGIISQAIELAVNSTALPGKQVSYFTAAGNDQRFGYASDLRIVDNATARSTPGQGVNLSSIPASIDTSGGFHDFDAGSGIAVSQLVTLNQTTTDPNDTITLFILQWDDPFDLSPTGITTDLTLMVFDAVTGDFIFAGSVNNFSTNQPLEFAPVAGVGQIRVVIARGGGGTKRATKIKYLAFLGNVNGPGLTTYSSTVFGHSGGISANSVAAYRYDLVPGGAFNPGFETFSSAGPFINAFDAAGGRLASAESRRKPDFAAADGVNTTFFFPGGDYEGDGFPNFFGTSAAAPHAAAIAALMLQKAGGPGSLTPQQVTTFLQSSAFPRDNLYFSRAAGSSGPASVALTANGDSAEDPDFFRLTFNSPGQTLTRLVINLATSALEFDNSVELGSPFTVGARSAGIAAVVIPPNSPPADPFTTLTINFNGFTSGKFFRFGIDRDFTATHAGGNSADALVGARFTAFLSGPGPASVAGTFANRTSKAYSIYDGYGLIDAINALNRVQPQ